MKLKPRRHRQDAPARKRGEHDLIPHLMERLNSKNCRPMRRGAM